MKVSGFRRKALMSGALILVVILTGFSNRSAGAEGVGSVTPSFTPLGVPLDWEGAGAFSPTPQSRANAVSADGSTVVGTVVGPLPGGAQAFRWTAEEGMVRAGGDINDPGFLFRGTAVSPDGSRIGGVALSGSTTNGIFGQGLSDQVIVVGHHGTSPQRTAFSSDPLGNLIPLLEPLLWGRDTTLTGAAVLPDGTRRFVGSTVLRDLSGELLGGLSLPQEYAYLDDSAIAWVVEYRGGSRSFQILDPGPGLNGPGDRQQLTTEVHDISADGRYAVGRGWYPLAPFARRWDLETGEWIGILSPGTATGVSADGSVVTTDFDGLVWFEDKGTIALPTLLTSLGLSQAIEGWTHWSVNDVSDDGLTFVGSAQNPNGLYEAWVARIPEPAGILSSMVLGLAAILGRRGR